MSASPQQTRSNVYPVFRYRDAPAAIAWLAQSFGFKTMMEVPGPGGAVAHAEMNLGDGVIMLGSSDGPPGNPWSGVKQSVYVYVQDIDAHYASAKAAGVRIARELSDTPYGSREYGAWDVEGFLWGFGTFRPSIE